MSRTDDIEGDVLGQTVQVCIDGVMSVFQSRMRQMLDDAGIERPDPNPDEWYPLADFLAVLHKVERDTGENALTKIGESTPRFADWAVDRDDPADALERLTDAYDQNHRGASGGYEFERTEETAARVVSTTPYPAPWEKGVLKATAELNGTSYARVNVDETGAETVFTVEWR